jgi:hypothetical protein
MNNQRILKFDDQWNYVSSIVKPVDESYDSSADFLPSKFIVDPAGRVFVIAMNENRGFLEYDPTGAFVGYMGANKVVPNIVDYFWKSIATQEQRDRMDLFVPTEYNNISVDREGFIYTVKNRRIFGNNEDTVITDDDSDTPVSRLNALGIDILIRNGIQVIGDLNYGSFGQIRGPSRFIDVASFDNDTYACFDRTRGRIFVYDFQGELLYAFGGTGNREGYFLMPAALDNMGYSLYALDSRTGSITRFELTQYGLLINNALNDYMAGKYEESAQKWEQVLKVNGNYSLAYIGIGRAAFRAGDYKRSMEYYKATGYDEGYGRAFRLYRKEWIEKNISIILIIVGLAVAVPFFLKAFFKLRREIREA